MPKGTKSDADLALLTAVERGEVVTQQMLKQELGVSVGLINALVKRAVIKGLVKVREAPYKRYAYYLTPSGFVEKSRMVAEYLDYSLQLYREARDQYVEIFREIGGVVAPPASCWWGAATWRKSRCSSRRTRRFRYLVLSSRDPTWKSGSVYGLSRP